MATGLEIPIRARRGRLIRSSSSKQMQKLILLAASERESDNPFNVDAGINVPLFNLDTPSTRARIQTELTEHFDRWESDNRARMQSLSFGAIIEGELAVSLGWVDLEHDRPQELTLGFGTSGVGGGISG